MTATTPKIEQREAIKLLGIAPENALTTRRKHFTDDDWWKEGVKVFWSIAAYNKMAGLRGKPPIDIPEEPEPFSAVAENDATTNEANSASVPESPTVEALSETEDDTINVRIVSIAKNPRWVYGDLNGMRIAIACHPKFSRRIVRKTVSVKVTRDGDATSYHYQP